MMNMNIQRRRVTLKREDTFGAKKLPLYILPLLIRHSYLAQKPFWNGLNA